MLMNEVKDYSTSYRHFLHDFASFADTEQQLLFSIVDSFTKLCMSL